MKEIKHQPVNWINGLKLTNRHFLESYYNTVEALRNCSEERLTSYNYGLGEPIPGDGGDFVLQGSTITTLTVRLKKCNALTQGGAPIFYYDGLYGSKVPTITLAESNYSAEGEDTFYLMAYVNSYKLIPVGEPDPEEVPLHHPYALPEINLRIVPKGQINKPFISQDHAIIGEITTQGGGCTLNERYIPPVQKSAYHSGIANFIEQLGTTVRSIKNNIRLIYSRNIADRRRNVLANNTFILCEAFNTFYNNRIFFIEQIAIEQPPIFLVQAINELANGLTSALHSFPESERESLLQYYYEWINVTPSDFVWSMEQVTSIHYDHTNISLSLETIGAFMSLLGKMFQKMSELEYIGLMRENIVVGDESAKEATVQKKGSWTFME